MTPAIALPAASGQATPGARSITEHMRALAVRPQGVTVGALIDQYMAAYTGRDSSRTPRLAVWSAMLGEFTLEQVDPDLIYVASNELAKQPALNFKGRDQFERPVFEAKSRKKTKTGATVNRYVGAIAAVFTWAIVTRLTPKGWVHPCRGSRRKKEPDGRVRFLDESERTRLLAACRASNYPRLYALVLMAMLTGARRGELAALRWSDVDLAAGVAKLGHTKNGDRRTLVLLPQVIEALRPFAGEPQRLVFGSVRSKYQSAGALESAWTKARQAAGLKDFKFHDLRHTCASYMAQAGINLNVIADVLGHRSLNMTRRYSHLTTQTKAQAMRASLGEIK